MPCKGYWPWWLVEGRPWTLAEGRSSAGGECLLVKGEEDKYYTIMSTTDYDGTFEIKQLDLPEPPIASVYGIVSGGDPGQMYILMKNYILIHESDSDGEIIKRNTEFENHEGLSIENVPHLISAYISKPGYRNGLSG